MNCSSGNCYNWATFSQLFSYRNQIKLPYHELKTYRSHCEFPTAKIQWGESSMHPLIIALIGERSYLVFQPRISVILFFFGINEYIHIPCWEESLFRRSLIHHKSFFELNQLHCAELHLFESKKLQCSRIYHTPTLVRHSNDQ